MRERCAAALFGAALKELAQIALCLTERSLMTMFATFLSKFHVFALISLRIIGI
jgi:hypothetical protein